MPWVNYHSHSLYCDGKAEPEEFISKAVEGNFPAYGFSSHAPVPFPSRWNMPGSKLESYFDHLNRLKLAWKERIEIYTGLEIDYIEGLQGVDGEGLKKKGLDYSIGSVHYIGRFPDDTHFCFDGSPEGFFEGIKLLYRNDFRAALTGYYSTVRNMLENNKPDIVGHLDKIKMHNTVNAYFREDDVWYVDAVEETLDLIASRGSILEVNTRGLYKHTPPLLYPSSWILKRAFQKKIPVMINSDSHHPDEIDSGFTEVSELLADIGYRTLKVLIHGSWQDKPFTSKGLLF